MWLIILGIIIFTSGHMFRRLLPDGRIFLDQKLGEKRAKGIIGITLLSGFILVTIGYYINDFDIYLYYSPPWLTAITHLMMVFSLLLMNVGKPHFGHTNRLQKYIKHGMLSGLIVWSIAHLLINGTLMAFILFGSLGLWAVLEIFLLERNKYQHEKFDGSLRGDIYLIGLTAVIYTVFIVIHYLLGANLYPFI